MTENSLLFIDVEASAPIVKQEQLETPEHESSPDISLSSVKTRSNGLEESETLTNERSELGDGEIRPASRYHCSMCHYNTYHRSLFQEHLNRHKGIKPYRCELCPYTSVSKKYAKQHQGKHKVCVCGFVSKNRRGLKRHTLKCSENPVKTIAYTCRICQREYVDKKALAKHSGRVQACSLCSLACCSLKSHMAQVHGAPRLDHAKKDRFECALCPWSSSINQKILLHLIHHPAQMVDEAIVDVSVLRKCGILPVE